MVNSNAATVADAAQIQRYRAEKDCRGRCKRKGMKVEPSARASMQELGALATAATTVSDVRVRRWSYLKLDCGGPCVPKRCAKTKSILKKRIEGCAGRAVTQQQLGRGCCCRPVVVVVVVVVVAVVVVVVADVASSLAPYPKTQRYLLYSFSVFWRSRAIRIGCL